MVLDETSVRLSEAPRSTIVLPGNTQYVVSSSTDHFAKRYDMIACIHFNGVFTPKVISPEMRAEAGARGITSAMLIEYITEELASEVVGLGLRAPSMLLDKASIHAEQRIRDAFQSKRVRLAQVLSTPTASAKRISPLDNALFHEWKERIRLHCPLTQENIEQVMIDCWKETTAASIHHYYHHCGLMRDQDPYFDCHAPEEHEHWTSSKHRFNICLELSFPTVWHTIKWPWICLICLRQQCLDVLSIYTKFHAMITTAGCKIQ